jgi:hypothetical protein
LHVQRRFPEWFFFHWHLTVLQDIRFTYHESFFTKFPYNYVMKWFGETKTITYGINWFDLFNYVCVFIYSRINSCTLPRHILLSFTENFILLKLLWNKFFISHNFTDIVVIYFFLICVCVVCEEFWSRRLIMP